VTPVIKQELFPEQLKQAAKDSPAAPKVRLPMSPNSRLPPQTVRFAGTEAAYDEEQDILFAEPTQADDNVDSAVFDYPAYPVVNYASNAHGDSQADVEFPFAYRAFQELLASAAIQLYVN
jgi:hypothetical protein